MLHFGNFKRSALFPLSCRQLVGTVHLGGWICLRRTRDLHGTLRFDDFLCFSARRVCNVSLVLPMAEVRKKYIGELTDMQTVFNRRLLPEC